MTSDSKKNCAYIGNERIAIIGLSGRYPAAESTVAFWGNLIGGADSVAEFATMRGDCAHYSSGSADRSEKNSTDCKSGGCIDGIEPLDPVFFNGASEHAEMMGQDVRLFLEKVWNLLEEVGHTRASLKQDYGSSVGVFVASAQKLPTAATDRPRHGEIAADVSRYFDLCGPRVTVDTSCSRARLAVDLACRSLSRGNCKLAIAGSVDLSMYLGDRGSDRAHAPGLPGDGVRAVLLQPLSQAVADGNPILAVLKPSPERCGDDIGEEQTFELDAQAHMPDENFPRSEIDPMQACSTEMIVLSANKPDALRVMAWRLLDYIKNGASERPARNATGASLADIAYTLQSFREEMNCRLAMVVSGFEELMRGLEKYLLSTAEASAAVQKILGHTQAGVHVTVYRGDLDKTNQVASLLSGSAGEAMVNALLMEGDLGNVALCWVQGGKVDWKASRNGKSLRKVSLPVYPFFLSQHERQLLSEGVRSLSCFESEADAHGIRSASSSAVESALTAIWKELFGLERIGRHQNFFELGGDSQLGMHMISRVRDAMQVDLPLGYLYETPTIAKMSEKITHMAALSAVPFAMDGAETDQDYEEGIIR